MGEAQSGRANAAIGDRYRTATGSEGNQEELVQHYAEQAREQQASPVHLLSDAMEVVARDLGIDSEPDLINVAWIPSFQLDEVDPPWGARRGGREEGSWAGIVYLRGRRVLIMEVDVSYIEQLPFFLAESIQDAVIEEVREARPACPLHGHPLRPVATPSGSVWECPDGKSLWSCAMGAYHRTVSRTPKENS